MKQRRSILLCAILIAAFLSGCAAGESSAVQPGEAAVSEPPGATQDEAAPSMDGEGPGEEPEAELPLYEWEIDSPENHGMDSARLEELHLSLEGSETYSVITVRDGVLVDEFYNNGYDEASVFRLNSCSKSFTSALIGIAIGEGLIEGVDVPIAQYFPALVGTDKEAITIRHLLEHTSGIEWYEWNAGSTFREWRREENWVDYVLAQPVITEPGSAFNYTTGGPHLLAAILQEATGVSAFDYGKEHIFVPLGMDSVEWSADDQGVTDGGNGISMTARDAAKFGQLFLQNGSWDGQQIVPQNWVEESTRQQSSGIGSSGVYGYQWWIRTFGEQAYDTYYAMGHAGQYIFVIPDLDLVTVVTSSMSQDTYEPRSSLEAVISSIDS